MFSLIRNISRKCIQALEALTDKTLMIVLRTFHKLVYIYIYTYIYIYIYFIYIYVTYILYIYVNIYIYIYIYIYILQMCAFKYV